MERWKDNGNRYAVATSLTGWAGHFASAPLSQTDIDELAGSALAVTETVGQVARSLEWLEMDSFAAALRLQEQDRAK